MIDYDDCRLIDLLKECDRRRIPYEGDTPKDAIVHRLKMYDIGYRLGSAGTFIPKDKE